MEYLKISFTVKSTLCLHGCIPDSLLWMEATQPLFRQSECVRATRNLTDQGVKQVQGGEMSFPRSQSKLTADCMGYTANIYYSSGGWNIQDQGAGSVWWKSTSWFIRWPSSHCVLTWWKGVRELFGVSFIRVTIPFMRSPPTWPNHPQRLHLLRPSHRGLGFQQMNFRGTQTFNLQ